MEFITVSIELFESLLIILTKIGDSPEVRPQTINKPLASMLHLHSRLSLLEERTA
mgnify:CR=1 FL=1